MFRNSSSPWELGCGSSFIPPVSKPLACDAAAVLAPAPELVWELSGLHMHWQCAYEPEQNGSAPSGWHRDFAATRGWLRDWVAASGTRLDRDRPTRQTTWPGEALNPRSRIS